MKDKDEVMRQKLLRLKYDLIELTKQENGNTIQGVMDAYFRVCEQLAETQIQLQEALVERDEFRTAAQYRLQALQKTEAELSEVRTRAHLADQSIQHLRKENETLTWENRRLRGSPRNIKRRSNDG